MPNSNQKGTSNYQIYLLKFLNAKSKDDLNYRLKVKTQNIQIQRAYLICEKVNNRFLIFCQNPDNGLEPKDMKREMMTKCFKLSNGLSLPAVGLGTYKIRKADDVRLAVNAAIRSGYRLIDTAAVYRNEALISHTLEDIYADKSLNLKVD